MPGYFRESRPRLGRPLLVGLTATVGLAFAALMPLSQKRQTRALDARPDLLTLSYLKLELEREPKDEALRLRLTERLLATGQFDEARRVLEPAFATGSAAHPDAEMLRAEIDFKAWAAIPAHRSDARAAALARLLTTLNDTDIGRLRAVQAERIAMFCAQTGLTELRARIHGQLADAELENDARIAAADAAYMAAGDPLAAARSLSRRALAHPELDGAAYAARALERALEAQNPGAAVVLWRKLGARYSDDARVLELGLAALAGIDDVESLTVARALLAKRPRDAALRARIEDLTRWTASARGRSTGGSPAPLGGEEDVGFEVELPELSPLPPATESEALQLGLLLESVGAPRRALEALDDAVARGLVSERALWDLRVGIQLRLGKQREALDTLAEMDARFGATPESRQRRADLLLELGETEAALALLAEPTAESVERARRISAVAWELGDLERVRAAYRSIAASDEATAQDVRRLWLLEREAGDAAASARVALSGLRRYADPEFGRLALDSAVAARDEALLGTVLSETEKVIAELVRDAEQLRLRVTLHHGRAHRALRASDPRAAQRELRESARLLGFAERHADELGSAFPELQAAQEKQLFELALSSGDRALLARTYPAQAERLSARERVFVLHRLERDADAVNEAVTAIEGGAGAEDLTALQDDAAALSADMPRQITAFADALETDGLTAARAGAAALWSFAGGERLGARAEVTRLGSWQGPSLYLSGRDELAAEVSGGLAGSDLTLGVVALDGGAVRPLARLQQALHRSAPLDVTLLVRVNDRSRDTPELRVMGVEDEIATSASVRLSQSWSAFARAAAKTYADREDRDYLGAGVSVDGSVGRSWTLPGAFANVNTRLAAYAAPRFAESDAPLPDGAAWAGLGATLSRGQLSVAPVAGRRLSLLADATAGWLLPTRELGWSGKLGFGISVLGADQLSVAGSASNVLSNMPGYEVYTLAADYAVSQW